MYSFEKCITENYLSLITESPWQHSSLFWHNGRLSGHLQQWFLPYVYVFHLKIKYVLTVESISENKLNLLCYNRGDFLTFCPGDRSTTCPRHPGMSAAPFHSARMLFFFPFAYSPLPLPNLVSSGMLQEGSGWSLRRDRHSRMGQKIRYEQQVGSGRPGSRQQANTSQKQREATLTGIQEQPSSEAGSRRTLVERCISR